MKKVEAIIRSDKLEDLKNALTGSGLAKGMTVSQVLGYGNQRGFAEFVRGQRIVPTLLAKVKVEIVVKDMAVDEVVDAIRSDVSPISAIKATVLSSVDVMFFSIVNFGKFKLARSPNKANRPIKIRLHFWKNLGKSKKDFCFFLVFLGLALDLPFFFPFANRSPPQSY